MHVVRMLSKIGLAAFLILGGIYVLFGMTSVVFLSIISVIAILTGILLLFTLGRDKHYVDHKDVRDVRDVK